MSAKSPTPLLAVSLFLGIFSTLVSSHSLKFFQSCPNVDAMESFEVDRFLGTWYIIEIFSSINKCMTMNFTRIDENELEVAQRREFTILNKVNINHANTYTGVLNINDPAKPSEMTVKWPANVIGSAEFKVVDTDYDGFAMIFECQYVWLLSRRSFGILSRSRTLNEETISRLREMILGFGVDTEPLTKVDQSDCISDENATFTGTIDRNTFALLNQDEIEKIEDTDDLIDILGWEVPEGHKNSTLGVGLKSKSQAEPEPEPKS